MADWQAFATAFLGDTAGYINERKDKADDYADKLAEQAERNKGKLTQLRQAAEAQQGFVVQARGLYASDDQIEAALDSGPTGLQALVDDLSGLKSSFGNAYDAELVAERAQLPETFKALGNLDVYSRYGLGSQTMGDIEAPSGGAFARGMGTDAKARVRAEADAEAFGGTGMSVYDMAELDGVSGYTSKNTSSFLSYVTPKRFNPSAKSDETAVLMDLQRSVQQSSQYQALTQEYDRVVVEDPATKAANQNDILAQQQGLVKSFVDQHINNQVELFGTSYVDEMAATLGLLNYTDDDFTQWRPTPELTEEEALAAEAMSVLNGTGEADAAAVAPVDAGILPVDISEEDALALPVVQTLDTSNDPDAPDMSIVEMPDGSESLRVNMEGGVMVVADPNLIQDMLGKYRPGFGTELSSGTAREVAGLNITRKEAWQDAASKVTYSEYKAMSDEQLAEAGLPTQGIAQGSAFGMLRPSRYFKPEEEASEDAVPVEDISQDPSELLLTNHGVDIMKYMEDAGVVSGDSDQDIQQALQDWYGENSANESLINLGSAASDPSVVYAIRQFLK